MMEAIALFRQFGKTNKQLRERGKQTDIEGRGEKDREKIKERKRVKQTEKAR